MLGRLSWVDRAGFPNFAQLCETIGVMSTTPPQTPPTASRPTMSYARARLFLGTSCVGMWVVIAAASLSFGVPERVFSSSTSFTAGFGQLVGVIFAYTAISGAFDLFGGFLLPKEYGRVTPKLGRFLRHWFRGAALHGVILVLVGLILLTAARLGGFWLTLTLYLALSLLLVYGQLTLARAIGGLRRTPNANGVTVLSSPYPHFTGGMVGLGKGRLIVPQMWQKELSDEAFGVLVKRKMALIENGSRLGGVVLALVWNLTGFLLAYGLAGTLATVAGLVSFSLWSTLWAFLGVLVLPTLSKRGVFAGDALALAGGADEGVLITAIEQLDRDQDDEYSRAAGVETIFHPVPSAARRVAKLNVPAATWGLWHVARVALYLSWANLSLLPRAVHCNIGRPEVWVLLPSD